MQMLMTISAKLKGSEKYGHSVGCLFSVLWEF